MFTMSPLQMEAVEALVITGIGFTVAATAVLDDDAQPVVVFLASA